MRGFRSRPWTLIVLAALLAPAGIFAQETDKPLPTDLQEEVKVRLALLDVVVVDSQGRAVAELTPDDFEIVVNGESRPPDTFDVECSSGTLDAVQAVRTPGDRPEAAAADSPRRLVFVVDYPHLDQLHRGKVLDYLDDIFKNTLTGNDEAMIVTLAPGARIEQSFTGDRKTLLDALRRMNFDATLFARDFQHLDERSFFNGMLDLVTLLDVVEGPKGIVLFSNITGESTNDELLDLIAAQAAASRCSIYSAHSVGLVNPRFDEPGVPPG